MGRGRTYDPAVPEATIEPDAVLGSGRGHLTVLLVLILVRRAVVPLVLIGLICGALIGGTTSTTYDDVGDILTGLASPLAGVALAVVSRIVASLAGLAAAYPLSHRAPIAVDVHAPGRRGTFARMADRIHVTRALRELRWTRAVQEEAAVRLGRRGAVLTRADEVIRRSTLPLLGAVVVAFVVTSP